MLYLRSSVKKELKLENTTSWENFSKYCQRNNILNNPGALLSKVLLRYLANFLLLFPSCTSLKNQQPYIRGKKKEKKKKKTKTKQTKQLASYLTGFNSPPVTLIITSKSAKKVTFTQTRAHKYLSVRTQLDDIFRGSSLYATSQLQFLHEDKEMGCCGWHSGFGRTP